MFGRKSRAERLREEALQRSPIPGAALAAAGSTLVSAYGEVRPIAERLLNDEDLQDNIRDELSGEGPTEIASRLWDDNKLRKEIETAAEAAKEGAKRARGERVGGRGLSFGMLLLILGGVGFLFLNPKTGPEARRIAKEAFDTVRSRT